MDNTQKKNTYFISDLHLGLHPPDESLKREKLIVSWLKEIKPSCAALYLLGDVFDYWYEYRKVVPRGFTRFLGAIADFTDSGIPVYYFTGNHDVWVFDYLPAELGVQVFRNPLDVEINGKLFHLGHGDGLGPGDRSYKILRAIFHNKFLQFMFSRLHPNFSVSLGHMWSRKSRLSKGVFIPFMGEDKEHLIGYTRQKLLQKHYDYLIFGHRHVPMQIDFDNKSRMLCLGDWIINHTYAKFDGEHLELLPFTDEDNILRKELPVISSS